MWDATAIAQLIGEHLARHRGMEPGDVYKLLFQGVLGSEHLVASAEDFAGRLRAEYDAVPADESELLWESIRPDGTLGRLNLRPFKAAGLSLEWLVDACLRTAAQSWGTKKVLRAVWAEFVEQCRAGRWEGFSLSQVSELSAWLEERDFPAAHHSAGYREANRPAYRLVGRAWLTGWVPRPQISRV